MSQNNNIIIDAFHSPKHTQKSNSLFSCNYKFWHTLTIYSEALIR